MKIFISQPMAGKTNEEILQDRKEATDRITKFLKQFYPNEQFEIINNFVTNTDVKHSWLWYLGESLKYLSEADLAYFILNCQHTNRGCFIEYLSAGEYELPRVIELKPVGKCCPPELSFVFSTPKTPWGGFI